MICCFLIICFSFLIHRLRYFFYLNPNRTKKNSLNRMLWRKCELLQLEKIEWNFWCGFLLYSWFQRFLLRRDSLLVWYPPSTEYWWINYSGDENIKSLHCGPKANFFYWKYLTNSFYNIIVEWTLLFYICLIL